MSESVDLQDLNSRIDKIEVTLSHAVDAIEKIADVVHDSKKTDWGVIASWASVLIAVGFAVYMPISDKMGANTEDIKIIESDLLDVRTGSWSKYNHEQYDKKIRNELNRLEDDIKKLRKEIYYGSVQQGN